MCDCRLHHSDDARCTCLCPEHEWAWSRERGEILDRREGLLVIGLVVLAVLIVLAVVWSMAT